MKRAKTPEGAGFLQKNIYQNVVQNTSNSAVDLTRTLNKQTSVNPYANVMSTTQINMNDQLFDQLNGMKLGRVVANNNLPYKAQKSKN